MAGAIAALAIWPVFAARQAPAAVFTPAPLIRDDITRDQLIHFYEGQVAREPQDQIKMRMLAQFYLQRFREQYDLGDVSRAELLSQRSIRLQPQGNTSAHMTLAGAFLSYHEFREALVHERAAVSGEPSNKNAAAQIASLQMELGNYREAKRTLEAIPRGAAENPTVDSVRARYDELTGHLAKARAEIAVAAQTIDSDVNSPAYDRSWFHMRMAQLAMEVGDSDGARRDFAIALQDFPNNAMALMWRAKLERSEGDWKDAFADAKRSADLYPLPQALGYEADAQRALGENDAARATDSLIDAEQRLFDTKGINDRLLALYYAQRNRHLDRALRAAESDYVKRGDEIYADDTLGWVLAKLGKWQQARVYAERAKRTSITDPEVQYHTGIIAMRTGHGDEARALLRQALLENPTFDPFDAPDARRALGLLENR